MIIQVMIKYPYQLILALHLFGYVICCSFMFVNKRTWAVLNEGCVRVDVRWTQRAGTKFDSIGQLNRTRHLGHSQGSASTLVNDFVSVKTICTPQSICSLTIKTLCTKIRHTGLFFSEARLQALVSVILSVKRN